MRRVTVGELGAKAVEKQSTLHCVKIEKDGSHSVGNAKSFIDEVKKIEMSTTQLCMEWQVCVNCALPSRPKSTCA